MSESIEQTIFRLIQSKDQKGIQDLLNRGLATEKMVQEERKSYERICEKSEWKKYRNKETGKIVEGKPMTDSPKFICYREMGISGLVITGMKHFERVEH